jgi:murein DD-endopeptidase MepM/ murein hydrolase activator NlpD
VKGPILSRFGPLGPGERNDGVNIGADQGANVRAAAAGEVVYAGSDVKGFGNVVLIKHPDGWVTAYAHLGGIGVRIRDHVEQGQTIGTVGKSGGVDQPQLHFEARWSSAPRDKHKPVDPLKLLP